MFPGGPVAASKLMPYSQSSRRSAGRALTWGLALGVGAVMLRELVRPREQATQLIDWDKVEEVAMARSGENREIPVEQGITDAYNAIAAELEPMLNQALGTGTALAGSRVYPGLTPVGRRQWVRFNIRIFRQMFAPLERLQ